MYLVYLGESGNTGVSTKDANQPHHVHVGLLIHESQSVTINGEFNALFRRHFGHPPGEPGTPKEIRPSDLFQGRGYFRSWPPTKRAELIQDCLAIMIRRETPVITSFIHKQDFATAKEAADPDLAEWDTPTEAVLNKFLFTLSMFMDELNMSVLSGDQVMDGGLPPANFTLPVAQTGTSVKSRFMTDFLRSDQGMDATALVQNFCFVDPEHSVGNQLSNLCAYFIRRWLQNPDRPHPYFDGLRENKVIQVIYPFTIYKS